MLFCVIMCVGVPTDLEIHGIEVKIIFWLSAEILSLK